MIKIRRALFSVSDKSDLSELAKWLAAKDVELIASGGTAARLQESGLPVTPVEEWTGHPEAMDGRIKTLHPRIHGGILARRGHAGDAADSKRLNLEPIDLVVVNFYPFQETLKSKADESQIIEMIDVGGPSMVRAAAKNHRHVVVLTDPGQYEEFAALLLEHDGCIPEEYARACAEEAFSKLSAYDGGIADWLSGSRFHLLALEKVRDLRYGENPHQSGILYRVKDEPPSGLVAAEKLSGKKLSYNNLLDADGALRLLAEFEEPAAVIVKHVTPCGVGTADRISQALELALETDRISAFGGIVALNRPMEGETARLLKDIFLEVILAPAFSGDARQELSGKKALRLLEFDWEALCQRPAYRDIRRVWGGYLMQEADQELPELGSLKSVTDRPPTDEELKALELAWKVCKHVRSNAIVFCDGTHTLGIGAGQMSRVDAARLAVRKAEEAGLSLTGSVCASDAFFPFRDGLDVAARAGATAVIQPGGSVRDAEVIAAANQYNMAMVFTSRRHFRH